MEELFFQLIRIAVGTRTSLSRIPSQEEWVELYEMAQKQSVVGVVYGAMTRLPEASRPDDSLFGMWTALASVIHETNDRVNRQVAFVQKQLDSAGLRSYTMKGQGNATLYGEMAMMRQSGDIDVFIDGGFEKVMAYVLSLCEPKEWNELEVQFPAFHDTAVELHYRPFIMKNLVKNVRLQRYFSQNAEACLANRIELPNGRGEIAFPTLQFNVVHQMVHIYHHLFTEGVGLRQLMDYYCVLKTLDQECGDADESRAIIRSLGLSRFASALMWTLAYIFEGSDAASPDWALWPLNERDGRVLLEEVMSLGNFGRFTQDGLMSRPKHLRPFYKLRNNLRLVRFGKMMWFWSVASAVYWRLWKVCIAVPRLQRLRKRILQPPKPEKQ